MIEPKENTSKPDPTPTITKVIFNNPGTIVLWSDELALFRMNPDLELNYYKNKIVIDLYYYYLKSRSGMESKSMTISENKKGKIYETEKNHSKRSRPQRSKPKRSSMDGCIGTGVYHEVEEAKKNGKPVFYSYQDEL